MMKNNSLTIFAIIALAAILIAPAGLAQAVKQTGTSGNDDLCPELFLGAFWLNIPVPIPDLSGKDHLKGSDGNDKICGEGGDDKLDGNRGDDLLIGGPGKDKLKGGDGNDFMIGGPDKDNMHGGDGNDQMFGGAGDDHLKGQDGNDEVLVMII